MNNTKTPWLDKYRITDEYSPFRPMLWAVKKREPETSLTLDNLKNQWELQKGLCPYTGMEIILPKSNNDYRAFKHLRKASIDRINSDLPYVQSNIQIVPIGVNWAKNDFTDIEFREFLSEFCK